MSRKSNEIYKLIFSNIQSLSQNQEQVAKGGGGRSTPQTITVVGGREELLSTKNVEFFFGKGAQRRKLPHDLHGAQLRLSKLSTVPGFYTGLGQNFYFMDKKTTFNAMV